MLARRRARLPIYEVTLKLSGQHPYRREPEFQKPDGTAIVHVHASSWNDAERQAFKPDVLALLDFWSLRVVKIERSVQ